MTEKQMAKLATKLGNLLLSGTVSKTGSTVLIDFDQTPNHLVGSATMADICFDYLISLTPEDERNDK